MERYIKNPVSDVFRKINALNEISQKAQEADLELTKIRKTILEETKEGLKEVKHSLMELIRSEILERNAGRTYLENLDRVIEKGVVIKNN